MLNLVIENPVRFFGVIGAVVSGATVFFYQAYAGRIYDCVRRIRKSFEQFFPGLDEPVTTRDVIRLTQAVFDKVDELRSITKRLGHILCLCGFALADAGLGIVLIKSQVLKKPGEVWLVLIPLVLFIFAAVWDGVCLVRWYHRKCIESSNDSE